MVVNKTNNDNKSRKFYKPTHCMFVFILQEIVFASEVSHRELVISIIDDNIPELEEEFCVSLILPEGGAVIGDIPEGISKF